METAENIRRGMAPDEARGAGAAGVRRPHRGRRSGARPARAPWLESVAADVRYALRDVCAAARAFTVVVVLTLGLGIGANTAIFSVVRGVLLKPLPHRDGDRLSTSASRSDGPGGENIAFSVPEINDFRKARKTLGGIAEYSPFTFTLQER